MYNRFMLVKDWRNALPWFLALPIILLGQEIEKEPSPKALFQAVFWENDISQRFTYAPWGNAPDGNATLLNLNVHSSRLSPKFLYYGESPLTLYQTKESDRAEVTPHPIEHLEIACQYEFQEQGGIREEILFLREEGKKLTVKSYPFSSEKTGNGMYQFVSFAQITTYLSVGEQKFALPPGKTKNINLSSEDSKNVRITIYLKEDQEFKKVYSRKVMNHQSKRGIFFLRAKDDMINIMPIIDNQSTALVRAIGYGVPPQTKKAPEKEKNEPQSKEPLNL